MYFFFFFCVGGGGGGVLYSVFDVAIKLMIYEIPSFLNVCVCARAICQTPFFVICFKIMQACASDIVTNSF